MLAVVFQPTETALTSAFRKRRGPESPTDVAIAEATLFSPPTIRAYDKCSPFLVEKHPSFVEIVEAGKTAAMGQKGGHWNACTHVSK
jgi:hypothetical protein